MLASPMADYVNRGHPHFPRSRSVEKKANRALAAMEPGLGITRMGGKAQRGRTSNPQTMSVGNDDANALRRDAAGDGKGVKAPNGSV